MTYNPTRYLLLAGLLLSPPLVHAESWWGIDTAPGGMVVGSSVTYSAYGDGYFVCGYVESDIYRDSVSLIYPYLGAGLEMSYSDGFQCYYNAYVSWMFDTSVAPGEASFQVIGTHWLATSEFGWPYEEDTSYSDLLDTGCFNPPIITSFIPLAGPSAGSGTVEIKGYFLDTIDSVSLDGVTSSSVIYADPYKVVIAYTGATDGSHNLVLDASCGNATAAISFTTPVCQLDDNLISETSHYSGVGSLSGGPTAKFKGELAGYGVYTTFESRIVAEAVVGGAAGTNTCFAATGSMYGSDPEPPGTPNGIWAIDASQQYSPAPGHPSSDAWDYIGIDWSLVNAYLNALAVGSDCQIFRHSQTMKIDSCSGGTPTNPYDTHEIWFTIKRLSSTTGAEAGWRADDYGPAQ